MNPILRLDDQYRFDRLVLTLGILLISAGALLLAPARVPSAAIAFESLYLLAGIFFVHQFGVRGAFLVCGFLLVTLLIGIIGLPLRQMLWLGAGGFLIAAFLAFYANWIQQLQAEKEYRVSAESELAGTVRASGAEATEVKQKLEKQEGQLKTWSSMVGVVRGCSSTLKFEGLSNFILDAIGSLYPEDHASFWIASAEGSGRRYQRKGADPNVPDVLDNLAAQKQQNVLVQDQDTDYRLQGVTPSRFFGRSAQVCPLIEENQVYGNLRVTSPIPGKFSHEDMSILSHVAGVVSMTASNVRLYERTEELALKDGQTGLFKRYYFEKRYGEECKRALRNSTSLALMLFDIDFFKKVNDTYGHGAGDLVLGRVGQIILEVNWAAPLPCRWGGEEFLLALPDATLAQAKQRAEEIMGRIKAEQFPTGKSGGMFSITVSTGLAAFPFDIGDPDRLFQICDRRLYAAKNSGRDRMLDHD